MPTCLIDGKEAEFSPGENLVEVAKRVGIEIPVYCYHPALTVVAQCRMCMVEVEKSPKLLTACSTAASEGMVVKTQSDVVIEARSSVMEFLLINHPLDCPICDQSGECELQDYSFEHGSQYMRYTEERRTYLDSDMGDVITKNMNRCIHCTRCIRFGDEIADIREMVAVQRGNDTEITTIGGKPLETGYAGNYADLCPTGSLTLKDFRFHKRVWMLKKTATICEGCSRGCNMEIHHEGNEVYRCVPKENMEINRYWLCDEGRFNFKYLHDPKRIVEPCILTAETLKLTSWSDALTLSKKEIESASKTLVLLGTDLTLEEMTAVQTFSQDCLNSATLASFGTKDVLTVAEDADADKILKRKSKTANLAGAEKIGVPAFKGSFTGYDLVLVFRGGRAELPNLADVKGTVLGFGCFNKDQALGVKVVLPGQAFAEKTGTVINFQGVEQQFITAIKPPRNAYSFSDVFSRLAQTDVGGSQT